MFVCRTGLSSGAAAVLRADAEAHRGFGAHSALRTRSFLACSGVLTIRSGKPLVEATGEVQFAASFLEVFSEEAARVYGDYLNEMQKDVRCV